MEAAAPAGVLRLVRRGCPAGRHRSRRRPRALAAVGDPRARDEKADRAPAVGLGRCAREAGAATRATARPSGADRGLCVDRARAGRDRARSARRAGHSGGRGRSRSASSSQRRHRGFSTSVASRRRRACASSPRPPSGSLSTWSATGRYAGSSRTPTASSHRARSGRGSTGRRSSSCRRGARGTGWSRARRWLTGGPVVATDAGGLRDAIEDGVTGLVVPVGDPPALRVALEQLLVDEALRARLGSAARAHAEQSFSRVAAADSTIAVLASAARAR